MTPARRNIMLGTAGHVDHGKTALVKLLTGCDTDRLAEEKARGLTIELGFAPCQMADERIVGIVDVPGHVDFIRNMVAGAQGIDVVILVVAADDGVMPQTREHLDILTLMGVRHGLIALTKRDLVDAGMLELVTADIRAAVAGTFLAEAAIAPISNITGEGFDGFFKAMNAAADACRPRLCDGLFRLWIERSFPMHGFGAVASGIPSSGQVRLGDRLELLPAGLSGRVRAIEVYGQPAETARAGECVAINLTDVDTQALHRGGVLAEPGFFEPVTAFEADLAMLPNLPQELRDFAEVHVHVGTTDVTGKVVLLEGGPLAPGGHQIVQIRLQAPHPLAAGERFVIRAGMAGLAGGRVTTVGGGRVVATTNRPLRRQREWILAPLRQRRDALDDPVRWFAANLDEADAPLTAQALAQRAQRRADQAAVALAKLSATGEALPAGETFVHRHTAARLAGKALEALEAFHAANPKRSGLGETELRKQLEADKVVFDLAVAALIKEGKALRQGTVLSLAGRAPSLSDQDELLLGRIEQALRQAGLEPPLPADLAASLAVDEPRLLALLALLADRGTVVRLDPKVVMHADAVEGAKATLLELFRRQNVFETVAFRDALGVSRKFAVPLLDYFDTIRLTVRSGNRRTPGAQAKKLLAPG